jgi:hypothetical protein
MNIKIDSYIQLKTQAPFEDKIVEISKQVDVNENDIIDSKILNEVYSGRVDFLISEDKKIHTKAQLLNISEKVFRIDAFLEKVTAENPDLVDYKVLAVKKLYFGEVNLTDSFFDSFREDYVGFDDWFKKKSDEISYVCFQDNQLSAFLFLKVEDENENYSDITPILSKKKRLKIGTFKVTGNGYKIGERFLKIYVTIFDKRPEQKRLIYLLEDWGFKLYGTKMTKNGDENVYVKEFSRENISINLENPKLTFPYLSRESDVYIVPIYPAYHTELFPDSILKTESPKDFVENEPHRNALSKVYICRSQERNLKSGDLIVFYRTGGYYAGVATTVGVIESVITNIQTESDFITLCRKRSVFSDEELKKHWNYNPNYRPFLIRFLSAYSFLLGNRLNRKQLLDLGIISGTENELRGLKKITKDQFITILREAKVYESFIVD